MVTRSISADIEGTIRGLDIVSSNQQCIGRTLKGGLMSMFWRAVDRNRGNRDSYEPERKMTLKLQSNR
jgi:hypothetical protein